MRSVGPSKPSSQIQAISVFGGGLGQKCMSQLTSCQLQLVPEELCSGMQLPQKPLHPYIEESPEKA